MDSEAAPPPQSHQWCQSHLQRYIRTCIHLTMCVGIGCTITEGGSCAARADSCAAHSLQPGSPVSKVLYLSDIHFDKNYTAGLNAECGEPLCCRPPNGPPRESLCLYTCSNSCTSYVQTPSLYPRPGVSAAPGKRAADPLGDYNCDCPLQTLETLLQHVGNMSSKVCQGLLSVCACSVTSVCLVSCDAV